VNLQQFLFVTFSAHLVGLANVILLLFYVAKVGLHELPKVRITFFIQREECWTS
jgi:hypothetical protein